MEVLKKQRRKLVAEKYESNKTINSNTTFATTTGTPAKGKTGTNDAPSADSLGMSPVGSNTDLIRGNTDNGKKRPRSVRRNRHREEEVKLPETVNELATAIEEQDHYFSCVLDMIPEHLVLPAKEVPISSYASKYMKNKNEEAPKQSKKEESKKNKRARYAADNQKTVLERQQERARAEDEEDASTSDPVEEKDAVMNWSPREGIEEEDDDVLHPEGLRGKHMDVKSMEALRKRIAERIREFQHKRTAAEGSRRAKTVEKRGKDKAAKHRRKKPSSQEKLKDGATNRSGPKTDTTVIAGKVEPELPPLPNVEDVGDIEFSGLQGITSHCEDRTRPPKVGAPGSKVRRLHDLMASAEKKKRRLDGLKQSEEGKEIARKELLDDAIRLAGGEELKDNPAALKKIVKRKKRDKERSAAQWKDRNAGVKKEQMARQKKREDNLNRRKMNGSAVAGTADSSEKPGVKHQQRVGFEGKKQDFINKEKPKVSNQGRGRGRGVGRDGRGSGGAGHGGNSGRG